MNKTRNASQALHQRAWDAEFRNWPDWTLAANKSPYRPYGFLEQSRRLKYGIPYIKAVLYAACIYDFVNILICKLFFLSTLHSHFNAVNGLVHLLHSSLLV